MDSEHSPVRACSLVLGDGNGEGKSSLATGEDVSPNTTFACAAALLLAEDKKLSMGRVRG